MLAHRPQIPSLIIFWRSHLSPQIPHLGFWIASTMGQMALPYLDKYVCCFFQPDCLTHPSKEISVVAAFHCARHYAKCLPRNFLREVGLCSSAHWRQWLQPCQTWLNLSWCCHSDWQIWGLPFHSPTPGWLPHGQAVVEVTVHQAKCSWRGCQWGFCGALFYHLAWAYCL